MTDRDRELLQILAVEDRYFTVPLLRHRHPGLQQYTERELIVSAGSLVKAGLADRRVVRPMGNMSYKITDQGLVALAPDLL